jgi:hypothetical protein
LFTGSADKFISRAHWAARSNSFDCSLMVNPSGRIQDASIPDLEL